MPTSCRRCYLLYLRIAACLAAAWLHANTAQAQSTPFADPTGKARWDQYFAAAGSPDAAGAYRSADYVTYAAMSGAAQSSAVRASQCGGTSSCCSDPNCTGCRCNSWYLSVSGGWQTREMVQEVNDPQTFITFRNGFAANAALGYRFDPFRIEAEYSFMNNDVDTAGAGGLSSAAAGNINLRAFMFNLYHDVQLDVFCWQPYVGAGIGIYQSEINSLYPEFFTVAGAPLAGTAVNTTSDMPLAYQFRVGATRPIGDRTDLFLGYRYFRGEELEFAAVPFSNFAPTFHPDGAKVHSVELGLRVSF